MIYMAAWVANSYIVGGKRRQITVRAIRREKVRAALTGGCQPPGKGA